MKKALRSKTVLEIIMSIFIILIIILGIYSTYTMAKSNDIECYWTTKGIICGGKLGE